jgi:hypothetical protein
MSACLQRMKNQMVAAERKAKAAERKAEQKDASAKKRVREDDGTTVSPPPSAAKAATGKRRRNWALVSQWHSEVFRHVRDIQVDIPDIPDMVCLSSGISKTGVQAVRPALSFLPFDWADRGYWVNATLPQNICRLDLYVAENLSISFISRKTERLYLHFRF